MNLCNTISLAATNKEIFVNEHVSNSVNVVVTVVPREAVVRIFGGIGAMSPERFNSALIDLAAKYGVDSLEALQAYVFEVLRTLACPLD